jgi:hypothetical protein
MSRHARSDELLWHESVLKKKPNEARARRHRKENASFVTRLLRALNRLISR